MSGAGTARGDLLEVVLEEMEPLADVEPGIDEGQCVGGRERARDDRPVPGTGERIEAGPDHGRIARDALTQHEMRNVAVTAPRCGPGPTEGVVARPSAGDALGHDVRAYLGSRLPPLR